MTNINCVNNHYIWNRWFQVGITIHEIGHALGLAHEQARPDRNQFVTVNFANIQSGRADQFELDPALINHQVPYDYSSVMHYSRKVSLQKGVKFGSVTCHYKHESQF